MALTEHTVRTISLDFEIEKFSFETKNTNSKKSNLTILKSVTFVYQNKSLKVKRQVIIWEMRFTIYTPNKADINNI